MNWTYSDIRLRRVARPVRANFQLPAFQPWVDFVTPSLGAPLRLFCFHHAGGSALIYRDWNRELPATIEVCPIQLPGRGRRRSEPLGTDLAALGQAAARGLEPLFDRPFAFFGYSMGAALAFEVARVLAPCGPRPEILIVAGAGGPGRNECPRGSWNLSRDGLIARLRELNGTPEAVLENAEMMDYLLAIVRADFQAVETYRPPEDASIDCPIAALGGTADAEVSAEALAHWGRRTTRSFWMEPIPGDHSFMLRSPHLVIARVLAALRGRDESE